MKSLVATRAEPPHFQWLAVVVMVALNPACSSARFTFNRPHDLPRRNGVTQRCPCFVLALPFLPVRGGSYTLSCHRFDRSVRWRRGLPALSILLNDARLAATTRSIDLLGVTIEVALRFGDETRLAFLHRFHSATSHLIAPSTDSLRLIHQSRSTVQPSLWRPFPPRPQNSQ